MRHVVTILLVLYVCGLAAATVQGVLLQVSPKGVSADAFLFGGLFGVITIAAALLAWRVHRNDRVALLVSMAWFAIVGVGGTLVGTSMLVGSLTATDSYIGPLGLVGVLGGLVHLAAAVAASRARTSCDHPVYLD